MCCGRLSDLETRAARHLWSWPVSLHQWNQWLHNICHQRSVICLWLHTHCSNCCYLNNLFHWVLTLQSRIHNLYNLISIRQPWQSLCKRKRKGWKANHLKRLSYYVMKHHFIELTKEESRNPPKILEHLPQKVSSYQQELCQWAIPKAQPHNYRHLILLSDALLRHTCIINQTQN